MLRGQLVAEMTRAEELAEPEIEVLYRAIGQLRRDAEALAEALERIDKRPVGTDPYSQEVARSALARYRVNPTSIRTRVEGRDE
jgi:uncharacterized protein with von Willebrand factor type A (vWA) domain